MNINSKLLVKKMQYHANMTEANHLGAALITRPEKLVPYMNQLFSSGTYYSDNPLTTTLEKMGSKKTVSTRDWEYDMRGASTRPLTIVSDIDTTNTTKGKYKQPYYILGSNNDFLPGDVLSPGNVKYQARVIKKEGTRDGAFVYLMRNYSDDSSYFIPQKYFKANTRWNKLFSIYEEASEQAGSTQFSTPMTLKNRSTKLRKTYKITDYALTDVLATLIPDGKGKLHKSWIRFAEVEYWMQWYREKERALWYTRSTDTVKGANGRPAKSGAGIDEILEDSWKQYYNVLTARVIEDFIMSMLYGRKSPGKSRAGLIGYAGDYGMLNFHRAMSDLNEKRGFIRDVNVVQKKVKSPYHDNAYETGLQYVRYLMSNGATLEIHHNPIQDDSEIHREIDPITGYPIESQKIYLMDMAKRGKENNVMLVEKENSYSLIYTEGSVSPFGPKIGGTSAHKGEYYEMTVSHQIGAQIIDPTACGVFELNR